MEKEKIIGDCDENASEKSSEADLKILATCGTIASQATNSVQGTSTDLSISEPTTMNAHREAHQGSNVTTGNFPSIAADGQGTVSIDIKDGTDGSSNSWLDLIMDEPAGSSTAATASQKKPKIQKVQRMLRKVKSNENCFDPRVVSIGPLHHGKSELKVFEKLKFQPAREFGSKCNKSIDDLRSEVEKVASKARKFYAEHLNKRFTDEKFAQMMFLDGCFILQFVCGRPAELRVIQHAPSVVRDMFLLENQIPYQVLRVLMGMNSEFSEGEKRIIKFVRHIISEESFLDSITYSLWEWSRRRQRHPEKQTSIGEHDPIHLLELFRRQLTDPYGLREKAVPYTFTDDIGRYISSEWYFHRSAKDFKTAGIKFRPSETSQCTDIEFTPTYTSGILTLPKIIIDEKTKSILLNLAAYEADPDNATDLAVTSYICFMDSIIDTAEDVKVLRSNGILLNSLGSDQQVADIFNEIATKLVPSPDAYRQVKDGIKKHHENRIKVWVAEWHHTYFRSPWTFIAVIAAIFALTLSVFQTVFGGYQTYLTAHPPQK